MAKKPIFGRHLIFRSGVHTKAAGETVWPPDRVRGVLDVTRRLSPAQIPYTLLHPTDNLPIFGYADRDSLQLHEIADGTVTLSIMPSSFANQAIPALKAGGLDKVSIGLGENDEVVHIGIVPKPAVDGLGNIFSSSDQATASSAEVVFSSADLDNPVRSAFSSLMRMRIGWIFQDLAQWMQGLRDRTIEAKGVDAADKEVPTYLIDSLKTTLPDDDPNSGDLANGFSTTSTKDDMGKDKEIADLKAAAEVLKSQRDTALGRASELETAEKSREIKVFLDGITNRVPPSMRDMVEGILSDLQGLKPRTFAAADGQTAERTSFDVFKDILSAAKPVVTFGEAATRERSADAGGEDKRPQSQRAHEETLDQVERVSKG